MNYFNYQITVANHTSSVTNHYMEPILENVLINLIIKSLQILFKKLNQVYLELNYFMHDI